MRPFTRTINPETLGKDMPAAYVRFVERTYREAWAEYEASGCPFGMSDTALAIWVEFGRTTRSS